MALSDVMASLTQGSYESKLRRDNIASSVNAMVQEQATQQIQAAHKKQLPLMGQGPPVIGGTGNMTGVGHLGSPLKGEWNVTTPYGPRTHPITGNPSFHTGVDLSAGSGTPIFAASNGIIRKAVHGDSIYGNQIILGMGHKWQTMYGHLSRLAVKPGQRVRRGQIIGYVGSTGLSTGPHLHYELWHKQNPVNPFNYYKGRRHR